MARKPAKLKLRAGENIGSLSAEQDHEYLKDCFVDLPLAEALKDVKSPRCLLLGRTGSGKSALLWHIEHTTRNVSRVDPKEVSFEYVGNCTIVRHLTEIGVDLHVFYEYLWKHILTLHIIRECLGIRTDQGFTSLLDKVRDFMSRDRHKETVLRYLEANSANFWRTAEQVSHEVTTKIADAVSSQIGLSTPALQSRIESGAEWSEHEKRTFRFRAQEIVSSLQMRELNETLSAVADLMADRKRGAHYIAIDGLDERWGGDTTTQYGLIRAIIESIKSLRRVPNLKVIVAIREDLYEATLRATTDRHFQAEKFDDLICRVRWGKELLHRVIELRLNRLFHQRYTTQGVRIEDVLPKEVSGEAIRGYLVDRTLRRPRDIIAFVNEILATNEGAVLPLPTKAVSTTEPSYSRKRREALVYEWRSCHPLVETYLDVVARCTGPMVLAEFGEPRLCDLVCEAEFTDRRPADEIERLARQVYERNKEDRLKSLARAVICCLFKVGAIGVKLHPDRPYTFCYDEHSTLKDAEISDHAKVIVHPMLASALGARRDAAGVVEAA